MACWPSHLSSGGVMEKLRVIASNIGITRISDITGLDLAGIPVIQAVRPLSLSNAVSQGKGPTFAAAATSAVFEAVESYAAEKLDCFPIVEATAKELAVDAALYVNHLLTDTPRHWQELRLQWIKTQNLFDGQPNYVPLELIHTAFTYPPNASDGIFASSTTGLAAGFTEEHAVMHGLMEVIERDAICRARGTHGFFQRQRIDVATVSHGESVELLASLRQKGFLTGLWHAPSVTGTPVVWCHLVEDCEPESALLPLPSEGSAAHIDAGQALCRAVHEAAQSRLTAISGVRDDFTRAHLPRHADVEKASAHRKLMREGHAPIDFKHVMAEDAPRDTLLLLSSMQQRGCNHAYIIELDVAPLHGIAVIKALVPHLLPLWEN